MDEELREIQRQKREKWLKEQEQKKQQQDHQPKAGGYASSSVPAASASASASATSASASTSTGATSASTAASASTASTGTASSPAPKPAATSSAAAASSSSNADSLKRVHILPLANQRPMPSGNTLQIVGPELRRIRNENIMLRSGQVLVSNSIEFVIVKSEPESGKLANETDYFVDGDPVQRFEKVQFLGMHELNSNNDIDSSELFSQYISPYFRSLNEGAPNVAPGQSPGRIMQVLQGGEILDIFGRKFLVHAVEPSSCHMGIVDADTVIYVDWDSTPEFEKIHFVPFQDTLPTTYEFDVFTDYLKPYLSNNQSLRFSVNDQFTYQGVQFKVVCCEPAGPCRVGRNSTIYCEGVLHPSLRNLLPPELLYQLSNLPPGLQMLLLNTDALSGDYQERLHEVHDMLHNRRGLSDDIINRVPTIKWGESKDAFTQTQCMVCLSDFEDEEMVRPLPCNHVFHKSCIDEWLHRCTDCPICKSDVTVGLASGGGSSGSGST